MANKKPPAGTILCAGCVYYDEITTSCKYDLDKIADKHKLTVLGCDFGCNELRKVMADYQFNLRNGVLVLSDEDFLKRMYVKEKKGGKP